MMNCEARSRGRPGRGDGPLHSAGAHAVLFVWPESISRLFPFSSTLSVPVGFAHRSELFPSQHDAKCGRFGVGSHPESGFQDIDVAQSHGTQIETKWKAAN
jgi:hypothetical protein